MTSSTANQPFSSRALQILKNCAEGAIIAAALTATMSSLVILLRPFVASADILRDALIHTVTASALIGFAGGGFAGCIAPRSTRASAIGAGTALFACVAMTYAWTGWDGQSINNLFATGPIFWPARARGLMVIGTGAVVGALVGHVTCRVLGTGTTTGRLKLPSAALLAWVVLLVAAPFLPGAQPEDKQRVVLIGLDGASLDIIGKMSQRTPLPHLSRMIDSGASGLLRSEPPFTPPSFSTLATGKLPAQHRIDAWRRNNRDTGARESLSLASLQALTGFEITENNGLEAIVFEWPMVGRDAPGMDSPMEKSIVLLLSFGNRLAYVLRAPFYVKTPQHIRQHITYRENETGLIVLAHYFWRLVDPELMGICIKSTDSMQHKYWHATFPEEYGLDADCCPKEGEYIPIIYGIADQLVGGFLDEPSTDVIAFSDHGGQGIRVDRALPFVVGYSLDFNAFLEDWGYVLRTAEGEIDLAQSRIYDCSDRVLFRQACVNLTTVRQDATGKSREELLEAGRKDVDLLCERLSRVHFEDDGASVFPGPFGTIWNDADLQNAQILIDMTGEDPPVWFPNYDSFELDLGPGFKIDHFSEGLDERQLTDGEHHWRLGDLLKTLHRTANHSVNGFIAAHGPNVAVGQTIDGARTADIIPTALHLLDLPVGRDMDGRVLADLFGAGTDAGERPVDMIDSHEPEGWVRQETTIDTDYDRRLNRDLKAVGYIN